MGKHIEVIEILSSPYEGVPIEVRGKMQAEQGYTLDQFGVDEYITKRAALAVVSPIVDPLPVDVAPNQTTVPVPTGYSIYRFVIYNNTGQPHPEFLQQYDFGNNQLIVDGMGDAFTVVFT